MYNLKTNNYHLKPKNSTIYTPSEVSQFIFELLRDKIPKDSLILDPCCGIGNLLRPWGKWNNTSKRFDYKTYGIDNDKSLNLDYSIPIGFVSLRQDFLTWDGIDTFRNLRNIIKPQLILCNPPFNGAKPKSAPEAWLDKIIELFGKNIPLVLFVPAGFCLNLTLKSKRYEKFEQGIYPPISSRITLPTNIFEGVKFHSEILIFNIKGLKPHYFYKDHE